MARTNKPHILISAGLLTALLLMASIFMTSPFQHAAAAPGYQVPIYTPTAGPDGKIIYVVKANDTLLSISLVSGVSVDTLRGLNNLTGDTIYEGQKLLLGLAGPAETSPTPGPSPTPTFVLPTPTPEPGTANLCIILFNDENGDSIRQETEASIPDGAISVNNRTGSVSITEKTGGGLDPICFEELPEGDYTMSVAAPAGYNPTTASSFDLTMKAGDETYVDFGAQVSTSNQAETIPQPPEEPRSPLMGILGAVFLIAGIGLAVFAGRLLKR